MLLQKMTACLIISVCLSIRLASLQSEILADFFLLEEGVLENFQDWLLLNTYNETKVK